MITKRDLLTNAMAAAIFLGLEFCAVAQPAPSPERHSGTDAWLHQHAQVIASTDPAVSSDDDLTGFGEAIGDAQVVALSEPDHGSGTVLDLKTRLVKYLHEKKGFDVLMLEGSSFATQRVWEQANAGVATIDALAPDNLFYMYSKTVEGRRLLFYLDSQRTGQHPLVLSSFDVSGTGAVAEKRDLLPMLEAWLATHDSTLAHSSEWHSYRTVMANSVIPVPASGPSPTQADMKAALSMSDRLDAALCSSEADLRTMPASAAWWCQVVRGLRSSLDDRLLGRYDRDQVAGASFLWYVNRAYKGHKIIIWAHYAHIGKGTQKETKAGPSNMGSVIAAALGSRLYVAAFTASGGTALKWWNPSSDAQGRFNTETTTVEPDEQGSLEEALERVGPENLFVDARGAPAALGKLASKAYGLSYDASRGFHIDTSLGRAYDGIFWLKVSKPATINR